MADSAETILSRIKDEEIDWVDLRFTDPKGKWQHLTMCSSAIDDDALTDGLMFDGSSIEGWKAIAKIFVLAVILDVAYALIVFRRIYPFETLDVACLLAVIPYALLRGPINRLAQLWIRR